MGWRVLLGLMLCSGWVVADVISVPPPAAISVWGVEVAVLRQPYEGMQPADRAAHAEDRLLATPVARDYRVTVVEVKVGKQLGALVRVNGEQVFGLLKEDAPAGQAFADYGAQVKGRIEYWLQLRDEQQRPERLLKGVGYTGLGTLVFVVVLLVANRGRSWILGRLATWQAPRVGASQVQLGGIYLLPYLIMLGQALVRLAMLSVYLLLIYLWLVYVLRQFPYTLALGRNLTAHIVDLFSGIGLSLMAAVPGLVMVGIVFWLAALLNGVIKNVFSRIESGRLQTTLFDRETAKATRRLFSVLVWLFALVVAYPYIPGSDTEAFKGVSVFVGLIISLGSAGIVSQLLGGLIVVYTRAFQPGEFVRIGEHEGTVTAVGVLSTKLRTLRKEEITIPNAVLLSASSTNFSRLSRTEGLVVGTTVTIGYDTPWPRVHQLLLAAAAATDGVRPTPEPQVLQLALSDFYVEYRLLVSIDDPARRVGVLSLLHQQILDRFAAAGVQIMSPHFENQPAQPVLPATPAQPG